MTPRRCIHGCLLALLGLVAWSAEVPAAIFTVGTGAGCTHGTIQSAINAAEANGVADTVRLTRSLTYQPEANVINTSQNLNVVGGFATCTQAATDNIKTVVSGQGGAAEPVFRIFAGTGSIIKLRHLTITLGDEDGGGGGGGIYFKGDGGLELIETDVTNNSADYGGGIYAEATGNNAELVISNNTTIGSNTARRSGGGVYIAGPLEMTMTAPSSIIAFNQALGVGGVGGYGGGLHVQGPAIAYIGTSGAFGLGAIYSNSAVDGGGISIQSAQSDGVDALVHLFTTDPQQPVTVRGNSASDTGGAIYVQGWNGAFSFSDAYFCASDFRIEDNFARDGSALYMNESGFAYLNRSDCTVPSAVRCASGVSCNTMVGNDAGPTTGGIGDGATLRNVEAYLFMNRFELRANRGGYAIRTTGQFRISIAKDCLLADNEYTRQLISSEASTSTYVTDCTLAGNSLGSSEVMRIEGTLDLFGSIIDQPGRLSLAYSGSPNDIDVEHVLASDITTLPNGPTVISDAPAFVDAANGDYHLRQYSPAVDFAPPVSGDDRDLDNQPRDQDLSGVADLFGVRDLGAYERQAGTGSCGAADTIFCDGFDP
ncbi:hypothetical protein [Dokdonella sp.]|uniref:hypothetical protein n=1 Tax=Dokdonella sp. TaxID=2291710 RepID=UPI002CAA4458|nr:hypothetical protein [Dokdonella sp.]HOX72449.1 hypothetical protein [Dokdonella sp.]HPN78540.1 hypothetical protein [Dokdonella sp.]